MSNMLLTGEWCVRVMCSTSSFYHKCVYYCVCVKSSAAVLAPKWKQNRCQLEQAVCVTEGPRRYTLDVRHDALLLFSNIG